MTKRQEQVIDLIYDLSRLGVDTQDDGTGQIVIYTGMKYNSNGSIIPMEEEDDN